MSVGYVAYIDESGDDGLRRVQPMDRNGSSEWFVLSAVVARIEREQEAVHWVRQIKRGFTGSQRHDLHYASLSSIKRRLACERIAQLPIRGFVVMSNKKNMRGYNNPSPAYEKNWFYWWCTRLLLERVTRFAATRSLREHGEVKTLRIVFSQRGGMSYERFRKYLDLLRFESEIGHVKLNAGNLDWRAIDLAEVFAEDHRKVAGLQLADCIAGSFFEAVSEDDGKLCAPHNAILLRPRIFRAAGPAFLEHGIKPMPSLRRMQLGVRQRTLFEAYGHSPNGW